MFPPTIKPLLVTVLLLAVAASATACLWDSDTLMAERSRFPTVLELITGKFIRHTSELYQWRIDDRRKKLAVHPNDVALYDDIAVAYDKLGNPEKAIEVILEKDKIKPGLYETEANLGTFLIHAGRLEESLDHIKRAIAINPDAHFGRERYQQKLVEYILERRQQQGHKLPLCDEASTGTGHPIGFAEFLARDEQGGGASRKNLTRDEVSKATQGVLGMMRFARHDSPFLLESLGDLLLVDENESGRNNASLLAARAYFMASYQVEDSLSESAYRVKANNALEMTGSSFEDVESLFKLELADGNNWFTKLSKKERQWIAEGEDVEAEIAKQYESHPEVRNYEHLTIVDYTYEYFLIIFPIGVALVYFITRRRTHASNSTAANDDVDRES